MEYEGVNKLARAIQKRVQDLNNPDLTLDFGGIQSDFSLKTNTFPIPIPKSDYLVLLHTYCDIGATVTSDNQLKIGKQLSIKPGDRVLVAWVGNDAVVIDVLVPAAEVM